MKVEPRHARLCASGHADLLIVRELRRDLAPHGPEVLLGERLREHLHDDGRAIRDDRPLRPVLGIHLRPDARAGPLLEDREVVHDVGELGVRGTDLPEALARAGLDNRFQTSLLGLERGDVVGRRPLKRRFRDAAAALRDAARQQLAEPIVGGRTRPGERDLGGRGRRAPCTGSHSLERSGLRRRDLWRSGLLFQHVCRPP